MNAARTRTRRTLAPVSAYLSRAVPEAHWARIGREVGGVVVQGGAALRAVRRLRQGGYDGPLVVDPAGYAPRRPRQEGGLLPQQSDDERWIEFYASADVDAVVSPGAQVGAGNVAALQQALAEGVSFLGRATTGQAHGYVALALPSTWFKRHADRLAETVADHGVSVAVVGVDANDPFSTAAAVDGLKHLLGSAADVMLLRSDLAALGAVAHGATLGAVGLSSTVRHFAPPMGGFGGSRDTRDRSPSLLVPGCAVWARGSQLWRSRGDRGMLECPCRVCDGATLRRFRDENLREEAHLHSVEVWKQMASRLLASASRERPLEWSRMCVEAVQLTEQLESLTGVPLRGSALAGWVAAE